MAGVESPTSKRGGRRAGAGRKKRGNWQAPSHTKRPPLSFKHPVHVVLRARKRLPEFRVRGVYIGLRRVLARYLDKGDFRVVHISIQNTHLHLIVEAQNKSALTHGMQSLAINAARAINRAFDRQGKVFAFRYSAKQIKTASYARNAISYVLNNWRRHREDFANGRQLTAILDEFSSAISFTCWVGNQRFKPPSGYEPLPVSAPTTVLLQSEWQKFGAIDPFERPGPLW
jgi:REP element-mobilizing transposase RayT